MKIKTIIYYVFVIYIPPSMHYETFVPIFHILSTFNCLYNENILIIGDFNIPHYTNFGQSNVQNPYAWRIVNGRILDFFLVKFSCIVNIAPVSFVSSDPHHSYSIFTSMPLIW